MRKAVTVAAGAAVVAAAALIGLAAHSGGAGQGFSVGAGEPIAAASFSAVSQRRLEALGASRIGLLGARGGRAYLKIQRTSGETCYGAARTGASRELLDVACLDGSNEMPTPVVDMSGVAVDPATGAVVHVVQVEGVAADQVATVGIEVDGRIVATTPVANNVYRFQAGTLPAEPDAVVGFSKSGDELWRKPI
jgi:hypothetical protein